MSIQCELVSLLKSMRWNYNLQTVALSSDMLIRSATSDYFLILSRTRLKKKKKTLKNAFTTSAKEIHYCYIIGANRM